MKKLIFLFLILSGIASAQTVDTTIIRGRAFMANGVTPYPNCRITILGVWATGVLSSSSPQLVQADSVGRFAFSVPKSDSTVFCVRAPIKGYDAQAGVNLLVPANVDSAQFTALHAVSRPASVVALLANPETVKSWARSYVQDSIWKRALVEYTPGYSEACAAVRFPYLHFRLFDGQSLSTLIHHPAWVAANAWRDSLIDVCGGFGEAINITVDLPYGTPLDTIFYYTDGDSVVTTYRYHYSGNATGNIQFYSGVHILGPRTAAVSTAYIAPLPSSGVLQSEGMGYALPGGSSAITFRGHFEIVTTGASPFTAYLVGDFTAARVDDFRLANTTLTGSTFDGITIHSTYTIGGALMNFHGIYGMRTSWKSTRHTASAFDYSRMDSCSMEWSTHHATQAASTNWYGSDLRYMQSDGSVYHSTTVNGAQPHDGASRFDSTWLANSQFTRCDFDGSGYWTDSLDHPRQRTRFSTCNDSATRYIDCEMRHMAHDSTYSAYVAFRYCELDSSTFIAAVAPYSEFSHCEMPQVDVTNMNLSYAKIRYSNCTNMTWTGATCTGLDLTGSTGLPDKAVWKASVGDWTGVIWTDGAAI